MRYLLLGIVLILVAQVTAADVVAVNEPGAVVLEVADVPVSFKLAHIQIPEDASIQAAALKLLKKLAEGQKLRIKYEASYGEAGGTGRVHLLKSNKSINIKLVEAGLAQYAPGSDAEDKYAKKMAEAEAEAKSAKKGIWGEAAEPKKTMPDKEPEVAVAKKEPKKETSRKDSSASMRASAKYVAELSGKYFYSVDSSRAKRLNKRRIVYYKTQKEALDAGKKEYKERKEGKVEQTLANADKLMAKGEAHYTKAVDMPATYDRDKEYGEAFRYLTQAMLIYRSFYEKDETNEKLGETLRACMHMRYGAMKNKRP